VLVIGAGPAGLEEQVLDRLVRAIEVATERQISLRESDRKAHDFRVKFECAEAALRMLKSQVEECQATIRGLHQEASELQAELHKAEANVALERTVQQGTVRLNQELRRYLDASEAKVAELEKKLADAEAKAGRYAEQWEKLFDKNQSLRRLLKEARHSLRTSARQRS
jgi:uncharacterized protein YhaN